MVEFLELPIDILPVILRFVVKSSHLAAGALVDKTWNEFATPRLYERVSIFSWHKDAKTKVLLLFKTLSTCPHLAKHVRRLEVRDFPKAILHLPTSSDETSIPDLVLEGIKNCKGLHSCVWTRDGSLSSEILEALSWIASLRQLELNGRSQGQYDPRLLAHFRGLQKVSIIMPSSGVVSQLQSMMKVSGGNLRSVTIICKSSPVLTDATLEEMAPNLPNLEQFFITGCPKVTERGVSAIVSSTQAGLRELGLEGVSPKFDMRAFAQHCTHTNALQFLCSIILTTPPSLNTTFHSTAAVGDEPANDSRLEAEWIAWTQSVNHLLSASPHFERFQLYATSTSSATTELVRGLWLNHVLSAFWAELVRLHGATIKRFSVLRMAIGEDGVRAICLGCPGLEELFIVSDKRSLDALPNVFRLATNLRTIHVNFPLRSSTSTHVSRNDDSEDSGSDSEEHSPEHEDLLDPSRPLPFLLPAEALALVKRCGPSVTQFGCNTKVWRVGRKVSRALDGTVEAEVVLLPYESPDIPEPFLVVRT
ncbi:hypothetical protein D9611_000472 [Ephemerocybe angulata]|uniref:F-box domain-containing protein n=1 Tax=Ephemerocybe angulata TaxID=980116 RepID=A0A8H5BMQ1_9AGAR|nr:hypothetical protein D9611_000472 [Tulosesus angulatus]